MTSLDQLDVVALVDLARAKDQAAWRELVRRYAPVVWRVTARHRLDAADAKDVSQNTWVTLAAHLDGLRRPEALAGWLATTARRECLLVHRTRSRWVSPGGWQDGLVEIDAACCPEPSALLAARNRLLWRAFGGLPARCRRLLELIAFAPELSHGQLALALGIRTGSVGRARGRCLDELRGRLTGLGVRAASAG